LEGDEYCFGEEQMARHFLLRLEHLLELVLLLLALL
jgi:hypothetical protein